MILLIEALYICVCPNIGAMESSAPMVDLGLHLLNGCHGDKLLLLQFMCPLSDIYAPVTKYNDYKLENLVFYDLILSNILLS